MIKQKVTIKILIIIIFILSFSLIVVGISRFYTGFHNIDLGSNMRYISAAGFIVVDTGEDGIVRTGDEIYSSGLDQIKQGFWITFLSSLIFGGVETALFRK